MRRLGCLLALMAPVLSARAEIIDRIAVTVDKIVITESDIVGQMRVAAFLGDEPLDLSAVARRQAARRLVEQALIQREMEITRYPAPSLAEADLVLEQIRKRFGSTDDYQTKLDEYGIEEELLRRSLLRQITTLRFIDFRFRPGIAVSDREIEQYYRENLLPELSKNGSNTTPSLDDSRDEIEEVLINQRVDEALDRWLAAAASQARIEYREEAFR
jgi:peptidyl-prolyl cis-trans isomerase SurA